VTLLPPTWMRHDGAGELRRGRIDCTTSSKISADRIDTIARHPMSRSLACETLEMSTGLRRQRSIAGRPYEETQRIREIRPPFGDAH